MNKCLYHPEWKNSYYSFTICTLILGPTFLKVPWVKGNLYYPQIHPPKSGTVISEHMPMLKYFPSIPTFHNISVFIHFTCSTVCQGKLPWILVPGRHYN